MFKLNVLSEYDFIDDFILDLDQRIYDYSSEQREPALQAKTYFIDSSVFLLYLIMFSRNNHQTQSFRLRLQEIASIFGNAMIGEWFSRFLPNSRFFDPWGSYQTLRSMLIFEKETEFSSIPLDGSLYKEFFSKVGSLFDYVSTEGDYIHKIYTACVGLDLFSNYLNSETNQKYNNISNHCYRICLRIINEVIDNIENLFLNAQMSHLLWITFAYTLKTNNLVDGEQITLLETKIITKLKESTIQMTKYNSLPEIIYLLEKMSIAPELKELLITKLKSIIPRKNNSWQNLPKYTLGKLEIYKSENQINFKSLINPILESRSPSIFNAVITLKIRFTNMIDEDSSLKSLIRNNNFLEKNFRDYYKNRWIFTQHG